MVDATEVSPEEQAAKTAASEERAQLYDYQKASVRLKQLTSKWSSEVTATRVRRDTRNVDVSAKELRDKGVINSDETIVPIRIIDTNISREQPPFVAYLTQSRRIAIFRCVSDPSVKPDRIETEFTNGMTYSDWQTPLYKTLDGSQTHGWDGVEVVFDISKPLHVGFEHIGHEKLIFPLDAINLQNCAFIIRVFSVTRLQLRKFVKDYDFADAEVQKILAKLPEGSYDSTVNIHKVFFKCEGVVSVAWACLDTCDNWLKAPTKLYLGRQQQVQTMVEVPTGQVTQTLNTDGTMTATPVTVQQPQVSWQDIEETQYPVFILPYRETEQEEIATHKGRVFLDGHMQEALTAVASSFVNGLNRASNVYSSVTTDNSGSTGAPKQLNMRLEHGGIYDKPLTFWHTEYPDPSVLQGLQYFITQNQQESGQVDFAASNRKDSRKTAEEIKAANQQASLLNSVTITLFSTFIRNIYSFAWLIVQSQALQDKVKFLLVEAPSDPNSLIPQPKTYTNDLEAIEQIYDIRAAGDVDVVQRAEKLQRMQQFWAIVAQTPLASPFMAEMLKIAFPEDGQKWEKMLEQGDPKKQLIQTLWTMVQSMDKKGMTPQEQQQFQGIAQMVQQTLAPVEGGQ